LSNNEKIGYEFELSFLLNELFKEIAIILNTYVLNKFLNDFIIDINSNISNFIIEVKKINLIIIIIIIIY
jgi:hypothetical protein